jgi:hypothetical protein
MPVQTVDSREAQRVEEFQEMADGSYLWQSWGRCEEEGLIVCA